MSARVLPIYSRPVEDVVSPVPLTSLQNSILRRSRLCLLAFATLALPMVAAAQTSSYLQTNIISDGAVPAAQTDPTLLNPWGVSIGPQFWIDSPGSGLSLVEDANGTKNFSVAVPPAQSTSPHGSPSGTVYNTNTNSFLIAGGYAQFLFGTLDGTIAAWNTTSADAVTVVNNSAKGAAYTDIALDQATSGTFLLGANFAKGTVDVFSSSFAPAQLAGSFSDPTIPAGYAPFGIHALGGKIFVTYAQRSATGRENVGSGLGYVSAFDLNGNLLKSAISQGALNAPWGMALAPSGFGSLAGDLLVANFGDGVINAYDPSTYALIGQVQDAAGNPIANPGLWEILFGSNGVGDPNTLYFAAGINNEKDGLFGSITLVQPAAGTGTFAVQSSATAVTVTAAQAATVNLTFASKNGFSGPVTLSCTGLPADTACNFSPNTLTLQASGTQSVAVSFSEATPVGVSNPYAVSALAAGNHGVAFALLGPMGLLGFVGFRRRKLLSRGSLFLVMAACIAFAATGCSSSGSPASTTTTPAPAGTPATATVMVVATSGTISQSTPITLTLQ